MTDGSQTQHRPDGDGIYNEAEDEDQSSKMTCTSIVSDQQ